MEAARHVVTRVYKEGEISNEELNLLIDKANGGDANAEFALGEMYNYGNGVEHDMENAARLYKLAADQNHADAQFALGDMYDLGRGVDKDEAEAYKLYLKAKYLGLGDQKQLDDLDDRLREIKRRLIKDDATKIYEDVNTWWRQVRDL